MMEDGSSDGTVEHPLLVGRTDRTWTRRGLIGGAAVVGAGAVVAVAKAPEAGATAGLAVLAGVVNTGAAGTALLDNIGPVPGDYILAVIDAAGGISSFPLSATVSAAATDDNTKAAVLGYAASTTLADGVHGRTDAGGKSGVSGEDRSTAGGYGVTGNSTNGTGVYGTTTTEYESGVLGSDGSDSGAFGVSGVSALGTGVYGETAGAGGSGVHAYDESAGGGYGLSAVSLHGTAIRGVGEAGYGVSAQGASAPLFLTPAATAGPPTTGSHAIGELYTDSAGGLYYCVGPGSPGTWIQVAAAGPPSYAQGAFCLLPIPIRLLDTRPHATAPTAPQAPITGGDSIVVPVTGQSVGGVSVPAGAVAVIGNVTAVDAVARGFLTLWPDGVTRPETSSINYPPATAVANGVTVALSAAGALDVYASQTTDVVFDATGFIA